MSWNESEARLVGNALYDARGKFGNGKPSGGDIVFETLKTVADIDRRLVVRGYFPGLKSGLMPEYNQSDLTKNDLEEIFRQRMIDVAAGVPIEVVFGLRVSVSPAEIATADAVRSIFRECLVGHKQDRDWRILQIMAAAKKGAANSLAKQFHITSSRVYDRRKLQCDAIWSRVERLIPKQGKVFTGLSDFAPVVDDDPVPAGSLGKWVSASAVDKCESAYYGPEA